MVRLATILALALVIGLPSGAFAKKQVNQQVDMGKYTCGDLLSESDDDAGVVLIWVDGYLSGKTGDTTIDMKFLEDLGTAVGQACKENKKDKLLNVVEKLTKQ